MYGDNQLERLCEKRDYMWTKKILYLPSHTPIITRLQEEVGKMKRDKVQTLHYTITLCRSCSKLTQQSMYIHAAKPNAFAMFTDWCVL